MHADTSNRSHRAINYARWVIPTEWMNNSILEFREGGREGPGRAGEGGTREGGREGGRERERERERDPALNTAFAMEASPEHKANCKSPTLSVLQHRSRVQTPASFQASPCWHANHYQRLALFPNTIQSCSTVFSPKGRCVGVVFVCRLPLLLLLLLLLVLLLLVLLLLLLLLVLLLV